MKILLAEPRGFCAGVEMAIATVERALDLFGAPLYVYHEIVHNKHVVEHFVERGVIFVENLEDVPEDRPIVFSAHGVSPEIRRQAAERKLQVIDATCPLVAKVHYEAIRFARKGYTILLIGHAGHDEVVGTMGEAPDRICLIESIADVDKAQVDDPSKVAYLSQTTLSVDDAERIHEAIRDRFPHAVGPKKDDICYATQNRQAAVKKLLDEADVALILGSKNSSNSSRLAEIVQTAGKPAYLIDDSSEIDPGWLHSSDAVLISAGASAPEDDVVDCIDYLKERFGAKVEYRQATASESAHFPLPRELRS